MVIWKFEVPLDKINDVLSVEMPAGARVLSVGNQNEKLCFWALVNPQEKPAMRLFLLVGTGNSSPDVNFGTFIGTVQFMQGTFVLHVFDAN